MIQLFKKRLQKIHHDKPKERLFLEPTAPTDLSLTSTLSKFGVFFPNRIHHHSTMYSRIWMFSGNLEVTTKKPISNSEELLDILSLYPDNYEGPSVKKPIVLATYFSLGTHLTLADSNKYSNYVYTNTVNKRIQFEIISQPFRDEVSEVKWIKTRGQSTNWVRISFTLSVTPTNRPGERFLDFYRGTSGNELNLEFTEVANQFEIQYSLIDGQLALHL